MIESENSLTVRALLPEEAQLASDVERLSLGHEAWTADGIRETMELNGYYYAAFRGNSFVGSAGFTAVLDEGYITNIAVHPDFRRRGVATELTNAVTEKAKELKLSFLSLEVRESNAAAISLYEKFGFLNVGRRKNFYSEPTEDAVIMTLNF